MAGDDRSPLLSPFLPLLTKGDRDINPVFPASVALILAAGSSTRMGICKATLPWLEGHTLLTYQVQQWQQAGFSPVVVLSPETATVQTAIPQIPVVLNPNPEQGKTASILAGLQAIGDRWDVLAIAAVDQPRPASIYQTLLHHHRQSSAPITLPTYQGRRGHPLLFSRDLYAHLIQIREETLGLRQLVQTFQSAIQTVETDTPIVLADLNTVDTYQHWFQRVKGKG